MLNLSTLLLLVIAASISADEGVDDLRRAERLKFTHERFHSWTLSADGFADGESSRLMTPDEQPLLHYTNPVQGMVSDGTLFVWRDGTRPIAACSITIRGPQDPPAVYVEMSSLTAGPLRCERNGNARWTPRTAGLASLPIPDAEPPSEKAVARLVAMRNLARRFRVEEFNNARQLGELRLLPQPIDRFQDESQAAIDGALFAFVEANDPQLLLMIEAQRDTDSGRHWRYTLARMSSREQRVYLDEKEVFSATRFWQGPMSPDEPYREMVDGRMILEPVGTNSAQ